MNPAVKPGDCSKKMRMREHALPLPRLRSSRCAGFVASLGAACLGSLMTCAIPARAEIAPETLTVQRLATPARPHWVWINDISFDRMLDGRAYLIDADTGRFLGMISGGYGHGALQLSPDRDEIYVAETYLSRGSRGTRTDVLSIYSASELKSVGEVEIPAKRFHGMPFLASATLSDDGRFSYVYNFTPAQSVTVVDVHARRLSAEIQTPGCALVFPSSPRRFHMLCGDGAFLTVTLDESGAPVSTTRTTPLFDAQKEPLLEKAVRSGARWYFVSTESRVHAFDVSADTPRALEPWSLVSDAERQETWRVGGLQPVALHEARARLYVLMHQGLQDTHKDPGTEVWVYDVATLKRTARISLDEPLTSIAVSQDEKPLLYGVCLGVPTLFVYDGVSGKPLRRVDGLGTTMTIVQTPARRTP